MSNKKQKETEPKWISIEDYEAKVGRKSSNYPYISIDAYEAKYQKYMEEERKRRERQRQQQNTQPTVKTPTYYYTPPTQPNFGNTSGTSRIRTKDTAAKTTGGYNPARDPSRMRAGAGVSDMPSGKGTGNPWDRIRNHVIRERQAYPNFMTERPEDYNDRDEEYDRELYDFYYGKGKYDTISRKGNRDEILRRMSDIRDLWKDFDNGNVAKVASELQAKTKNEKKYKTPEDIDRYGEGNIDLDNRKVVRNSDGSISTERSFSVNIDGKEVLLPTVVNGMIVSEEEAIRNYEKTGEYLGKFNTHEEADEYAELLHERQSKRYNRPETLEEKWTRLTDPKNWQVGNTNPMKNGGQERAMTPYEVYSLDPEKRKEAADIQLGENAYKNWLKSNAFNRWNNLENEEEYWQNVSTSAENYKGMVGEVQDASWDLITSPKIRETKTLPMNLLERPEDYNDHDEEYDRELYDTYYGQGMYDRIMKQGSYEDKVLMFDQVRELWRDVDSGALQRIADIHQGLYEQEGRYDYQNAMSRKADDELKEIEFQKAKRADYERLMDKFATGPSDPQFIPEYDKGGLAYGNMTELENGVRTNDVHRIYSLLGGGKEYQTWKIGDHPKITNEYSYAMMMSDGVVNGVYDKDRDEIGTFMSLYNADVKAGKEPTRAKEFLDGLLRTGALQKRYEEADKIYYGEMVRQVPAASNIVGIGARQVSGLMALPRTIAGLFGDESVKDPNSAWWAATKAANMITDESQKQITEKFGETAGKIYRVIGESVNDVLTGLLTKGMAGDSALLQRVFGYTNFYNQVYQEQTLRNMETMDYTTASLLGALDGVSEVVEEVAPFETMLGSVGKGLGRAIVNSVLSNAAEEGFGATVLEKAKGWITGRDTEQQRADEIIAQRGYEDKNGEWVSIDVDKDPGAALAQANKQAAIEFIQNFKESVIAGGLGGGFGGTYGTFATMLGLQSTGKKIRNQENTTSEGQTGDVQLVEAAKGMKGTESQQLANEIDEETKKGKKPSNYKIGKLAALMMDETSEQYKAVVHQTIVNRITSQLKERGLSGNRLAETAEAMARSLSGEKMTREDQQIIAREQAAIDLWKSYNSIMSDTAAGLIKEVNEATKDARSVANLVGELAGTTGTATSVIADEVNRSIRETDSVEGAIDNLTERRGDLISEEYADEAKNVAKEEKNQKYFLDDAVKIRLAAFSLAPQMPTVHMSEKSANILWEKAKAEFQEAEAKRIRNQAAVVPGKGKATFEGAEHGTEAWDKAVNGAKISGRAKLQMNVIAAVAEKMGNTVNFIIDDKVEKMKDGSVFNHAYVHGYETGTGAITINVAGLRLSGMSKNMLVTLAHEMTHWLEQNSMEGYAKLREFIVGQLGSDSVQQRLVDIINNQAAVLTAEGGDRLDLAGAMKELVAQSSEALFSTKAMRDKLAEENPTLFNQVKKYVRQFIARLDAAIKDLDPNLSDEARQLKQVRENIAKLWLAAREEALGRESSGEEADEGEMSYSVAMKKYEFDPRLKNKLTLLADKKDIGKWDLVIGETLKVLQDIGIVNKTMVINQKHAKQALAGINDPEYKDKMHKVSVKKLMDVIRSANDPIMIIESTQYPDSSVVIVTDEKIKGKPAIVTVRVATEGHDESVSIDVNRVTSAYGKEGYINMIVNAFKQEMFHIDGNRPGVYYINTEKAKQLQSRWLHVPKTMKSGLLHMVTDNPNFVKQSFVYKDTDQIGNRINNSYSVAQMDQDYEAAREDGNTAEMQRIIHQTADNAGYTDEVYHGTDFTHGFGFTEFDMKESQGEIFVAYDDTLAGTYTRTRANVREISQKNREIWELSDEELFELAYDRLKTIENENGKVVKARVMIRDGKFVLRTEPETYGEKWSERTITRDELENEMSEIYYAMQNEGIYHLYANPGNQLVIDANDANWNRIQIDDAEVENDIMMYFHGNDSTEDNHFTTRQIADYARARGYDSVRINNVYDNGGRSRRRSDGMDGYGDIGIYFHPQQVKSADPVTYDNDGNVIPPSERFNPNEGDIRFSVVQPAEANGLRFDEDAVTLYNKAGQVIDGVNVKVTEDMIEKTPIGMLINMARDGVTTKGGKVKFKPTISAETAKAQKKMFTDLMNMVARYKDSNLVWEIAGSTLYSALKANSDPQYSTTVDFGTVCAKTQEIINVMSRVMLEKGRGLTREEVLMVYNETANAGLTVPCPVCYVFSRWMGVPSLLNSMSQYQKRFVKLNPDGTINKKATQAAATRYINDAMKKYGTKAELDKAKTSITNRMKTQEKNRTDALVVLNSKNATLEEKRAAKEKHDAAIKQLDALTKDLSEVEAYNWVTQALCKETSKGSGKYVVDPEFEVTPDSILFDLRKTGEFAKYTKNWRYRNTRGAGMGKAIMPYSGMSIGDIIYGTERKSELKNSFLQMKAGGAGTAIKNAIIRARKQNLIGGQRLQSTSDYRPEWGLDYLMSFLELQAIGSKVQMYTKVAEAVDLLASMQADVNLSIMGAGSGFHLATEEEIRESKKNTKRGRDLRSRMGTTTDENGEMQTYILDFSDVTGMDYDTAKALKNKHDSVQMILVGMNDIHIRLALANPDIDFVIPWHSSGNTQDALKSMIKSVGEKLETSSDYQDTQSDRPAENQTEEQKQLWDLRMKILQGKNITAAEKKIIDADDWLSGLWERFNVEGVDPDCYQVELGAPQAAQIFPYEYWDKGLTKARANGNGQRFIEYCQHFGIIPRFSGIVRENEDGTKTVTGNFAGAVYDENGNITGFDETKMSDGYWKVLIDRPMYDNKGLYRDQQVVDVTKAKVGSLDAQGRLQDSDMPLKTSAMYGDAYSEQEKTATDNTLAALDMKAKLEAIGTNVTEEEEPAPRNNQSIFGAAAGVPTLNTQATSEAEVFEPAKKQARYADAEETRAFSVAQPDMEVTTFMQGLSENSLSTEQERVMFRQWKELKAAWDLNRHALDERTKELQKLERKQNPTAYDREQMRRMKNMIQNSERRLAETEAKIIRATTQKGFAKIMRENEAIMRNLVSGKTVEEVRKTVEEMTQQIEQMDKLLEKLNAAGQDPQALQEIRQQIRDLMEKGKNVLGQQEAVQKNINTAIQYNNNLAIQSEAATWKSERWKLIEKLRNENTQKLLEEQMKWKQKIAQDKQAREMMASNQQMRKAIHTNVSRIWKLLARETDQQNIPEHMKGLAREMVGMVVNNDLYGRKISGFGRKDLFEMSRVLEIMKKQDGEFSEDDLKLIEDEEAQDMVLEALANLEEGIKFYNASTGGGIITNLQAFRNALERIDEAVVTITNVIHAEQSINIQDRKIAVADAAEEIAFDMRASRFKGERVGRGSRQKNAAENAVYYGNMTPVYFIKNLKNRGISQLWEEMKRGQNRNGLEVQKAQNFLRGLAERTHFSAWSEEKHSVQIGSRKVEMTVGQMMELYAIWKREMLSMTENPQASSHLKNGGIILQEEARTTGKPGRERQNTKPMRVRDEDVGAMYDQLTDEQKTYLDEVVKYLSSDMSDLGNEASMKMYGIKKYKEAWYFPMKVWDGVKSARSDRGISGTNENRAAHKGWSKRRINKAQNALVIGDFTTDAVQHIVEMINYNTMAPAIENFNKILNYQRTEADDNGEDINGVKRNIRVMFEEAYGKKALKYLETFLSDLNGGPVQDQRTTLRDKMISVFRKNAVAGSLSVAMQQPLSYIRAAMMINPKYLAQAISPTYWKGSHAEMLKYSGVAVIKDMGRFDMQMGASAREYIAPEDKSTYDKISDALTILPEMMDRMTWTRMWSAVKLEQHELHPEMDIHSEAFLKLCGERFNDVMMQTQVYDSVMVKSQNMRSKNGFTKVLTSFMAEPTLSLNILGDAVMNAKGKEGMMNLGKAGATFALAAVMQAFFKGLMGSGRSPDEKKTWLENFLNKWEQNFISEANPLSLIPGYSDMIELLKKGELKDDAMSVIGKLWNAFDIINDTISGKKAFGYRTIEDTAAQIAQLFTNIPAKNIMRDMRAMYNYVSQAPYAKRTTSGAVLREQAKANVFTADNLLGALNTKLGEAGFMTSNKAYYGRLFNAMQRGNQAAENDIREYLTLAKGQDEKAIQSGLRTQAKAKLEPADASTWMIRHGMMDSSSTLTSQYKKGEISKAEYKKLLKEQDPKLTEADLWWKIDRVDYEKETGESVSSSYSYRLKAAISANSATAIQKAVKDMKDHGRTQKQILDVTSDWKSEYLKADNQKRVKIRDAIQKVYKAAGSTAEAADKKINGWLKEEKKKSK